VKVFQAGRALCALLLAAATFGTVGNAAEDPVVVPVMLPLTGPAAGIGQELQTSLRVLEGSVNSTGGIRSRPLHFNFLDDQGSPQLAVQLMSQLKSEGQTVALGGAFSALCKSMMPLVAKAGPLLYCLSPAVLPPRGSFVFSCCVHPSLDEEASFRYFRERGWNRLAFLTTTDASGEEADASIKQILERPENHALRDVAHERFNPADLSVTAQLARIKAKNPQAIMLWGAPIVLGTALRGINDVGLDIPVIAAESLMSFSIMEQMAPFLPKRLLFASNSWAARSVLRAGKQHDLLEHVYGLFRDAKVPLDVYMVVPWDPATILIEALRTLGPTATADALRAHIAGLHDYTGVTGVYDFRSGDQRGLGVRNVFMYQWLKDRREWEPVSLGGAAVLKGAP
jgi:branched-chain amino acid transport system substrate-binding protein